MVAAKIVLFTSKKLKNGEHPIMIRLTRDRKSRYVSTGISCSKDLWDEKACLPKKKHPNQLKLSIFLNNKLNEVRGAILDLEKDSKTHSPEAVRNVIKHEGKNIMVLEFLDMVIENCIKAGKIGNAKTYKDTKRVLSLFRNGMDLYFSDINLPFLKRFEQNFRERGLTENSISVYMRGIRAVFNKALAEGYIKADIYPFHAYKVSKLKTDTAKRAITLEQMRAIADFRPEMSSRLFRSQQLFMFSYYCRGINFTDMALLRWSNIVNDRLVYFRAKTGKRFSIGLLEPAKAILATYEKLTKHSSEDYIFPILDAETHITPMQIDNRIEKVNKQTNSDLKTIAKELGIEVNLTTYVARHSYATIMKRGGVSTAIISEALGHDSERTTQIYLDSFENEILDEASKAIL